MMNGLSFTQLLNMVPGTGFFSVVSIVSSLLSFAMYLVTAYCMYAIAKRRFLDRAWLAWIPVGNLWVLGSIADHYRLCARRSITIRRRVLMATCIAIAVLAMLTVILCIGMIKKLVPVIDLGTGRVIGDWQAAIGPSLVWISVVYLLMLAASIVQLVFVYMAYYDLYASCDPRNAVIYLVLSIVIPVLLPVFQAACHRKDDGLMPFRR